jgi:hypothetical protein
MTQDIAIQEIRELRHRMSAECDHDVTRFFEMLKDAERQFEPQIRRYHEIERQYQKAATPSDDQVQDAMILRDKPKS